MIRRIQFQLYASCQPLSFRIVLNCNKPMLMHVPITARLLILYKLLKAYNRIICLYYYLFRAGSPYCVTTNRLLKLKHHVSFFFCNLHALFEALVKKHNSSSKLHRRPYTKIELDQQRRTIPKNKLCLYS